MNEFSGLPSFTWSKRNFNIALSIVGALIFLIILGRAIKIVRPGYVAVEVIFGKVMPTTLKSGLHLINPFATILPMEIRTQEYTMSSITREGRIRGDDAIEGLTKEGLRVKLDLTIWYKIDPARAGEIYETIGLNYERKIIRPAIRTVIRDVTAKYLTSAIYSEKRGDVTLDIDKGIKLSIADRGIIVEKVLLRNVQLPIKIAEAIDTKLAAEQEAKQMEFVLQKARKEAEVKVVAAKGRAEAQQIINRTLTTRYLQHEAIQIYSKLAGSENTTFVIMPTSTKGVGMPLIIGK